MRETCWCDEVQDRSCKCGSLLNHFHVHNLNCPQHPMHMDCRQTLVEEMEHEDLPPQTI